MYEGKVHKALHISWPGTIFTHCLNKAQNKDFPSCVYLDCQEASDAI